MSVKKEVETKQNIAIFFLETAKIERQGTKYLNAKRRPLFMIKNASVT